MSNTFLSLKVQRFKHLNHLRSMKRGKSTKTKITKKPHKNTIKPYQDLILGWNKALMPIVRLT